MREGQIRAGEATDEAEGVLKADIEHDEKRSQVAPA